MVIENLCTRAARTGVGHLPEVVGCVPGTFIVTNTNDSFGRHTDFVLPNAIGFVVFLVDSNPKLFFGKSVHFSQQCPGKSNGITLEIISEAEITQHFEKSMVACGITYVLKIVVFAARAHAALGRSCPRIGPAILACKDILELHHARIGKQQRRIVGGYQRRRGHDGVPLGLKILQKFLTDLGRFHRTFLRAVKWAC